ncbi:MAG: adenylate kinase [Flavobacteriales bacterium]|jgi:adenylate kinase
MNSKQFWLFRIFASFRKDKRQNHMLNIVLFGPPGAGKGTQSENLIKKYGLAHLSTGDIFRANIKGETELGKLAKSFMDKGELVPDSVTIQMLESEVNQREDAKGFIFDGFPRTSAQATALDEFLKIMGTSITYMLALEVPEDQLRARLKHRAETSGRADDANPTVIQNRIDVYNRETAPVAGFYRAQEKFQGINGVGTIEDIANRLFETIDQEA